MNNKTEDTDSFVNPPPPAPTVYNVNAHRYIQGLKASDEDINDPVNHPEHYTSHPSGIECIDVTRWMNFNLGNAVKYIWRSGLKDQSEQDLRKAIWYLENEIDRIKNV